MLDTEDIRDEVFADDDVLAAPAGALGLEVSSADGVRRVALPVEGALVIGRNDSCELSVPAPLLSRVHARFTRRSTCVLVEDLGSRNGTWLGNGRVESAMLLPGAAVRLGDVVVSVISLRSEAESPPAERCDPPALVPEALYLSPAMRETRALLQRLARAELPVLIQGETGTGKELAARELHVASPRRSAGPLRVLNCAAISPHLIESTLFGHERGAFTGASCRRPGIFEEARGGTVFLDEVGELSAAAQAALLRVLESNRFTRVGATREIETDVRVIAATHRDLQAMAERGTFRVDLLHRLLVLSVELPPLRDRREEIAPLARHFARLHDSAATIAPDALASLQAYDWPGNLRELRNVIARATVLAHGSRITDRELSERVRGQAQPRQAPVLGDGALGTRRSTPLLRDRPVALELAEARSALAQTGGNQRRAAALLGVPLRTFERRLRSWRQSAAFPEGHAGEHGDPLRQEERLQRAVSNGSDR